MCTFSSSETIRVLNDPSDRYIICQTHGSSDMRKTTFVKECSMNQQTIQNGPVFFPIQEWLDTVKISLYVAIFRQKRIS